MKPFKTTLLTFRKQIKTTKQETAQKRDQHKRPKQPYFLSEKKPKQQTTQKRDQHVKRPKQPYLLSGNYRSRTTTTTKKYYKNNTRLFEHSLLSYHIFLPKNTCHLPTNRWEPEPQTVIVLHRQPWVETKTHRACTYSYTYSYSIQSQHSPIRSGLRAYLTPSYLAQL